MEEQEIQTITIDNLVYEFQAMPPQVQEMVMTNKRWNSEVEKQRTIIANAQVEINKLGYALAGLNTEVMRLVKECGVPPIRDLNEQPVASEAPEGPETGC